MSESPPQSVACNRYFKFNWQNLSALPAVGKVDYQPKSRSVRIFEEGVFTGAHTEVFSAVKKKKLLSPFGRCIYCDCDKNLNDEPLLLTGEHIIPEFLGAGLELPKSSCEKCQRITSEFEDAIARGMFDPIRKAFELKGKNGVLKPKIFPVDIGNDITDEIFIPLKEHPTILVMPVLFPASTFSRRHKNSCDFFNIRLYNINANIASLKRYDLSSFSTQAIDMVRFSQFICKIAHSFAINYFKEDPYNPALSEFIRIDYSDDEIVSGHLEHVGCLLSKKDTPTSNFHEIEVGTMEWCGKKRKAVRVRLFASYSMPSYYVTVE